MTSPVDAIRTALFDAIRTAVAAGDATRTRAASLEAVERGVEPLRVLEDGLVRSLREVGACWASGEVFLPEMMLSAEAVRDAIAALRPHLLARHAGSSRPGCVLGTVAGDVHDIGKNIIGTLLQAHGFSVLDLGTDVAAGRFADAVRASGARLVGLSALLTSTMPAMREVVAALETAGLRSQVRIAVGGAPVTEAWAASIGADGYAPDGMTALRLFERLAG